MAQLATTPDQLWNDMATAPRNGTPVRLLIGDRDADGCLTNEREIVALFDDVNHPDKSPIFNRASVSGLWHQVGSRTTFDEGQTIGWKPRTGMVEAKYQHEKVGGHIVFRNPHTVLDNGNGDDWYEYY